MTVIPALTLRNTGAGAVETNLKWSSDIALRCSSPVLAVVRGPSQAAKSQRLVLPGLEGMSIQADCLVCDR